ncbi:hypothetical protein QT981_29225 [Microcoleus sp. herbarium13]
MATLAAGAAIVIPQTHQATRLGFQQQPLSFMLVLGAIVPFYITEAFECETSVLQPRKMLAVKAQHLWVKALDIKCVLARAFWAG